MRTIKATVAKSKKTRLRAMGGEAHSDEAADRKLIKTMVKPEARTGHADGGKAKSKKTKGQRTQVNVIVAPRGRDRTVPVPVPVRGAATAAPVTPSRVPAPSSVVSPSPEMTPKRASGGRVHMTAGSESGEGRLQKAKIHAAKRK